LKPFGGSGRVGRPAYNRSLPIPEETIVLSLFRRLMKNEQAATALEYTLIAALIGLAALQVTVKMSGTPEM
jgi:Flp pilus assembly pilin Flp